MEVLFGKKKLSLDLSSFKGEVSYIRKTKTVPYKDPEKEISEALNNSHDKSFDSHLKISKSACIVICDITRPVPNKSILPILIKKICDHGLSKKNISILIATGLHRPATEDEVIELVGKEIKSKIRVISHDARSNDKNTFIGKSSGGIEVYINEVFLKSDLKIIIGLVEPHFMAGYSGGRKLISPGISSEKTIKCLHSYKLMSNKNTLSCNLDSNPLNDEQQSIIKLLPKVFAINTIIDENKKLCFVNFGDIKTSHDLCVLEAQKSSVVYVDKPYDLIITSSAGYPLDKTYYQTIKGIITPLEILKKQGKLLIFSECSEGFGSEEFFISQKKLFNLGIDEFINYVSNGTTANVDEWQTVMLLRALKNYSVSGYLGNLSEDFNEYTCINRIYDFNLFLKELIQNDTHSISKIAIIPEGPYVIPRIAK